MLGCLASMSLGRLIMISQPRASSLVRDFSASRMQQDKEPVQRVQLQEEPSMPRNVGSRLFGLHCNFGKPYSVRALRAAGRRRSRRHNGLSTSSLKYPSKTS